MVPRDRARARKMPHNVAREAAFYSRKITVGKCLIQAADDIGVGRRWAWPECVMPSPCIDVVTPAGARRRLEPAPANVADVTTTGYAAFGARGTTPASGSTSPSSGCDGARSRVTEVGGLHLGAALCSADGRWYVDCPRGRRRLPRRELVGSAAECTGQQNRRAGR